MNLDYSKQYIEGIDKFISERNEFNIQPDISGDVVKKTTKSVTVILSDDKNSIKFNANVDPDTVHVLQSTDPKSQRTKIQFYVSDKDITEVLLDMVYSGASSKKLYGKSLSEIDSVQITDSQPEVIKITKADGSKVAGKFYVFDQKLEFKIKEPINAGSLKLVYIPRNKRTI